MSQASFIDVCSVEELETHKSKRVNAALNGRYVTLFQYGEPGKHEYFCMDTSCYHAGGSLALGDIEEVNGVPCVKCPIHQFRISLKDGRQAQYTYDVVDDTVGPCYLHIPEDQGPRQRVHEVRVTEGRLEVRLSWEDEPGAESVASDRLACRGDVVRSNGARVHVQIDTDSDVANKNRRRSTTLPGSAPTPTIAAGQKTPAAARKQDVCAEAEADNDLL
eukprot:Rhum_TRINITY_DN19609_c0_g1::Rhum_TRINITY_DN19609_c0_g1_i1::g.170313::m.170313